MGWQGFLVESKAYMNHPDHWHEWNHASVLIDGWTNVNKRKAKIKFWWVFPRAWLCFHWFIFRDNCQAMSGRK